MSELEYNEPAETFAPIVEKSLYAGATAVMVPSETGCWVHYVDYCERIANIKSDADAVIADLENKLQNESRLLKETREWLIASQKLHKRCADNAVKIIRRSNRKYCLEMAMTCSRNIDLCICDTPDWPRGNVPFWQKWRKRWLELAEKYKPNNSTAR